MSEIVGEKAVYRESVKTDNATYAIVEPSVYGGRDNIVTHPLIPLYDIRQIDWSVTIGEGAIYNPKEGQGVFGAKIEIGYGAMVRGSVVATGSLAIESGMFTSSAGELKEGGRAELVKRPTSILGDVVSFDTFIARPGRKLAGYEPGFILVLGSLVLRNKVEISAPLLVGGSMYLIEGREVVFEYRENAFKTPFLVLGVIYAEKSKLTMNAPLSAGMIILEGADLEINAPLYLHFPVIICRGGNVYVNSEIHVAPLVDMLSKAFDAVRAGGNAPVNLYYALMYLSNILREESLIPIDNLDPERDRVKLGEDAFAITNLWRVLDISEAKKVHRMLGYTYW